jgi:general nucleoside transport system ATP-binding protein
VSDDVALALRGIVKHFGALTALDAANLEVRAGSVHALLGENGAGKTTLMRIAFGMIRPDAGTIVVDGTVRRFNSPAQAITAGLGMVHQHFALVGAMTVAENVALADRSGFRYDAEAAAQRVRALGAETGLPLDPSARVDRLSVEAQQRLEILKALARDAKVLILDEPTAVLAPAAAAEMLTWVRRFADSGGGRAVVLITHKLREALSVADDVTVLRRGTTVLTERARAINESRLASAMLGHTPAAGAEPRTLRAVRERTTAPVARLEGVEIVDRRGVTRIRGATFNVHTSEIVGIAAVEGEGQLDLLRVIARRAQAASGTVTTPPASAIGFVPEDRHRDGLILDFPLYENVALRGAGERHGRIRWDETRTETAELLEAFDIRAESAAVTARTLSGGNQQKLVLARELDRRPLPALLVAENPTRGLDINAATSVHERLRRARANGTAIIFYSSDLDEVLALSDRVLVIAHGTVRQVAAPVDRDSVGRAMLGVSGAPPPLGGVDRRARPR